MHVFVNGYTERSICVLAQVNFSFTWNYETETSFALTSFEGVIIHCSF